MKNNFDKNLCLSNIYYLTKLKNIKIGDLEGNAGVSTGYLSRLNKEDNTSSPSIECITAMAADLQVSLDVLVGVDLQSITKTEEYIISFLEKVAKNTDEGQLIWEKESVKQLSSLNYQHPLFLPLTEGYGDYIFEVQAYQPINKDLEEVKINDSCFHADLGEDSSIYIMSISAKDILETIFDVYLIDNGMPEPLCTTVNCNFAVALETKTLYERITESTKHAQLNPAVKDIIEWYVKGKKRAPKPVSQQNIPSFDEEIPF